MSDPDDPGDRREASSGTGGEREAAETKDESGAVTQSESDLPGSGAMAWKRIGQEEVATALTSVYLLAMALATGLIGAVAAFLVSPLYVDGLERAIEFVEGLESPIDEGLEDREFEAVELLLGPDPTAEDVITALEALLATGDVLATAILAAFVTGFGPLLGILVSVPSIASGRRNGRFRRLLDQGYSRLDVIVGTYLGRFVGGAMVVVAVAIGIAVGNRAASVGVGFLLVVILSVLIVGIFVALGTMIAFVARGRASTWGGSIGVLVVFWLLLTVTPARAWAGADGDDWVVELLTTAPGNGLPGILQRFHPYNVVMDGTYFVALSDAVDTFPRVSYVALAPIFGSESPPLEAVEALPFYLQHWFVYVVIGIWIAVPLAIATRWFDPATE